MSTFNTNSVRAPSLSLRRYLGRVAALGLLWTWGVIPLIAGCENSESCQYRCTEAQAACPNGLSCDVTLGYCVSPDYTGTCDAETHEVTVCENEPIELTLPDEGSSLREVEGLPSSAKLEGRTIKGKFARKTTLAFGGPEETRQYWRVNTTGNCPTLATEFSDPLCLGDDVDRNIQGAGGNGLLSYELVTKNTEFVLAEDGRLTGIASETGSRQLDIAITDERGIRKTSSLAFSVTDECADVEGELPNGCAGSDYEANLTLIGQAPIDVTDFTPTHKDGKGLSSAEAKRWQSELNAKVSRRDDRYVLEASPSSNAQGSYLFSAKLQNALSIEQRDVPFAVASCAAVKADFTVCEDESFDVDLAGSPGDVWTFYEQPEPLTEQLQFVSDRRLRGTLTAGTYSVAAVVENGPSNTKRLETLTLLAAANGSPGCGTGDAGPETFDESTLPVETDGGSEEPPALLIDIGCVNRPYVFAVPMSGISVGSWQAQLPDGLSIDEFGVIRGTPLEPFDGLVAVSGLRGAASVSTNLPLTIHEWCSVVFRGVPSSSSSTHLYRADRRPNEATVELSSELVAGEEAGVFAVSPNGEYVAYATTTSSPQSHRVVVKRLVPLPASEPELLFVGPLSVDPAPGVVTELIWGTNDRIAMLVTGVSMGDAAPSQRFVGYDLAQPHASAPLTPSADHPVSDARDILWSSERPCVTLAAMPNPEAQWASWCWEPGSPAATQGAQVFTKLDSYQARSHAGRLLQVHPLGAGAIVLTSWLPFADPSETWPEVIHLATFGSPRGDLVGTVRDPGMEIARAGDPTLNDPGEGFVDYTALGVVEDCTSIDAWASGGRLACSQGLSDPNEMVTIASPSASGLTTLPPFTAPGHATSARRIFVGDAFYVYDDLMGRLNYVHLGSDPLQVQQFNHAAGLHAVALEPLSNSQFVMQTPSSLWIGTFSNSGLLSVTQVSGADETATFSECEPAFGWVGFTKWCGGDEISRRFQVAPDADLGVFQTANSNLALFSVSSAEQVKRIEDIAVTCGDHPYCLTEFTFAR